jgi:HTH-type transcriptional regulator / antitoxin HigA
MEKRIMKTLDINQTITHWTPISTTIFVPHTEVEYDSLVDLLDRLIDQVGEDEAHPLASMMDVIGVLIENYETANVPELESIGQR